MWGGKVSFLVVGDRALIHEFQNRRPFIMHNRSKNTLKYMETYGFLKLLLTTFLQVRSFSIERPWKY